MSITHFDRLFSLARDTAFRVRYWDGTEHRYGTGEPEFTITFTKEPGFMDVLESPSIFFGEGYMRGEVELSGSYEAMARALDGFGEIDFQPSAGIIAARVLAGAASTVRSVRRMKDDIASHYDLGNEFFSLWLDKTTSSYSCAYFRHDDDSLDRAQQQKTDLVLRKMFLKPGMRILDIGCGWGWLALRAALDHDAEVLAITLSEEQFSAVQRRVKENGLEKKITVRLCNYLDIDPAYQGYFDRVVSVGMFEHVGLAHYDRYFAMVSDLLAPGGLSFLHTLTKLTPGEGDPWIRKYIFPGGRIPAVEEIVPQLSAHDFRLLHCESLRRHYAKTLDCWYEAFSRPEALEKTRKMFDEPFVRMWGLYLRMAAASLRTGGLDLHQFVFSKGVCGDVPMTLESVYCP